MDADLQRLIALLPEGRLVAGPWLSDRGFTPRQITTWLGHGALQQPFCGVYRRTIPATVQGWDVILSLQGLGENDLIPSGGWALRLHALGPKAMGPASLELTGVCAPPAWAIDLFDRPCRHRPLGLFENDPLQTMTAEERHLGVHLAKRTLKSGASLQLSSPERALLELLDDVDNQPKFEEADQLFPSLGALSAWRLSRLMAGCRSKKAKRLTLWFGERHRLDWASRLRTDNVSFGEGELEIVPGGRLVAEYGITVPLELGDRTPI